MFRHIIFLYYVVVLEGKIYRDSALQCLHVGRQPHGDQIPRKFFEEYEDIDFSTLSGVRVVRIAVHPSAMWQGYGSVALDLLTRYFEGQLSHIGETYVETANATKLCVNVITAAEKVSLLEETIAPKLNLPLLVHLHERLPERIHYIGASFSLTVDLFHFWKKQKFYPFYICDTRNKMTGEHSCMVIKPLSNVEIEDTDIGSIGFLTPFYTLFKRSFIRRLALCFGEMDYKLAMSILDPKIDFSNDEHLKSSENECSMLLKSIISSHDLKLLEAFIDNRKDYGKVREIVPLLAQCYFQEKLPVTLSYVQTSILLCMGLQLNDITSIEGRTNLERPQVLSLFQKAMRKFYKYLYDTLTKDFVSSSREAREVALLPHSVVVDDDLEDGAKQVMESMRINNAGPLDLISEDVAKQVVENKRINRTGPLDLMSESLEQYSIMDRETGFEHALRSCTTILSGGILSVKSNRNSGEKARRNCKGVASKKRKRGTRPQIASS